MILYRCGAIDNCTHVPGPVSQSSTESDYNSECTAGMDLSHFRMLIHELLNKDPDIIHKETTLIVLDIKYAICMAKNGKDTNHTRKMARKVKILRNEEN